MEANHIGGGGGGWGWGLNNNYIHAYEIHIIALADNNKIPTSFTESIVHDPQFREKNVAKTAEFFRSCGLTV